MNDSANNGLPLPVPPRASGRFTRLLIALFLLLFVSPFVGYLEAGSGHLIGPIIIGVAFAFVLVTTALAVSRSSFQRRVTLAFVGAVILVFIVENWIDSRWLKILQVGLPILFLAHSVVLIVQYSFKKNVVESDTVSASLCGYLLIGICFSNVFSLLAEIDPASFHYSHSDYSQLAESDTRAVSIADASTATALYFSFITLTTVGYGDITPATGFARMLTAAEALLGQIFMVVLVARLVGMHVAQSKNETGIQRAGGEGDRGEC